MNLKSTAHAVGLVVLVVTAVLMTVIAAPQLVGADHTYTVVSGSMEPTIHVGDIVFVTDTPASTIEKGDIITFDRDRSDDIRTTHRVVDVVERDDGLFFRTKGDANEDPDTALVPASALVGVVSVSVPYVGYVLVFGATDVGIVAFVVIPAVLLVLSEAWNLLQVDRTERGALDSLDSSGSRPSSESSANEGGGAR
ncbi:signal peptidase I [Haloferax profundi]|uniref:signal peptidase I n=1 Tax=Haloferax profundi TaxID=1544718 RepID=UPI0009E8186F|nr:signal peptidase I [Haloferax profundi]